MFFLTICIFLPRQYCIQWFDQFFGTTQPDDKLKNKKENKTTVEDSDCSSGCCKPNTTGVTTPNTTDAASVTAADALFQKSNKISLHEDDSSRFDALIASEHPTCVKFTASWCKPCQQQEPEMVQLAQKMAETGSHMRFVSVDVDVHDELFASLEIVGIPHIRLYQRSEMLETFTGRSTADLEKACAVLGKKNQ